MGCVNSCVCGRNGRYQRRSSFADKELVVIRGRSSFDQLPIFVPRLLSPFLTAPEMCNCEATNKQWHCQFTHLWQHLAEGRWGQNAVSRFVDRNGERYFSESDIAEILPRRQHSLLTHKENSFKVAYLEMDRRIWRPVLEREPSLVNSY